MDATTSWKRKGWHVLWVSTLSSFHRRGDYRGRSSQKISVSVTQRSEGLSPLLLLIYLKIRNTWTIAVIVFLWNRDKKPNHPVVCMTQKHQLKTIICITYYFMLGWNLGACVNSLYKLILAGSGRPLCWEKCGSAFRLVGVAVRGHCGSRDAIVSASSCSLWEMKTKKQRRLVCVLQSFLLGVCGGVGGG